MVVLSFMETIITVYYQAKYHVCQTIMRYGLKICQIKNKRGRIVSYAYIWWTVRVTVMSDQLCKWPDIGNFHGSNFL